MRCRIAELIVDLPEAGGLAPRCQAYLTNFSGAPDIVIHESDYDLAPWEVPSYELACYLESGFHFYGHLLRFHGMMLHASAVEYKGNAYLFSGPSGMGKSTHTRLWQQVFGSDAQVFNDDKPALRLQDGTWYAYGTPWCGKDGINQNKKVPLAGICFLKRGTENRIRRLEGQEAIACLLSQTHRRFRLAINLDRLLTNLDALIRMIPVYELECLPNEEAARLSQKIMCAGRD